MPQNAGPGGRPSQAPANGAAVQAPKTAIEPDRGEALTKAGNCRATSDHDEIERLPDIVIVVRRPRQRL
jgi:hypothetical protein